MEIDKEMTMEEIERRFDQEWVLINDPVVDEQNRVVRGRVRFHTPDRQILHEAVMRLGSRSIATQYIGEAWEGDDTRIWISEVIRYELVKMREQEDRDAAS